MDRRNIFYKTVLIYLSSLVVVTATTTCEIKDRIDCRYTVICELHAGNAYTPDCSYEPYVTFIVTKSTVNSLTVGFFGSTNFDSRVRFIKAIENTWPILDSSVFRYYSKTVFMDLSNNNIVDIRDEAFRNLLALESLNLSSNAIESLSLKTFLFSDSKKSSLNVLDLSHNALTELTSDSFVYVTELQELFLQNNKIETLSDYCFRNLSRLTHLYLQNNQIKTVNIAFSNLASLEKLDVSNNSLTKLEGSALSYLSNLEYLNVSHNAIEYVASNCFSQAFYLRIVDLSHNRIHSGIENVMFITNNKLEYLDFYQNNITLIQDNAFKHNVLTYLNLEKNNLTGELNENTCNGLQRIIRLDLSNQSITSLKSKAFSETVSLLYLNLSMNQISTIENSTFYKIYNLQILDLSSNKISCIDFLSDSLFNLTELYLKNNKLISIASNAFINQTLLIKLDLSFNKIKTLGTHSLPLSNLQYLNLYANPISGVVKSNTFSPANFLRFLDLSYFNITKVENMSLINLPVLAKLNISHNRIGFIDPNNFIGMENMYSLDMSFNELIKFELNDITLSNLKALYLNNNRLTNIANTLRGMRNLLYVDFSNNFIVEILSVPFSELPNLKVLYLSNNKIASFNNPHTNSLSLLSDLNLSKNDLTSVNLSYFKDLVVVDISNNKFSSINMSFFNNLDSLQSLDLSNTSIAHIAPGTFQNVKILKFLNLSHNHLTTLRYGSLRGLNKTEVLDLSYNEIAAIDVDVFHECSELRRLTLDYNNLTSLDIERLLYNNLQKLKSLSLGGNPISCKEIVRNMKMFDKNNMVIQVEVTSIDKIYHEDNVHGIKCGNESSKVKYKTSSNDRHEEHYSNDVTAHVLIAWCTILTIVIFLIIIATYLYRRYTKVSLYRNPRLPLESSLEFSLSNHSDLLS